MDSASLWFSLLFCLAFSTIFVGNPGAYGVGDGNDLLPDLPVGTDAIRLEALVDLAQRSYSHLPGRRAQKKD